MTTLIKFKELLAVDGLTNYQGTVAMDHADKIIDLDGSKYGFAGSMGNLKAKAIQAEHAIQLYNKGDVVSNRAFEKYDCCLARVDGKFYTVELEGEKLIVCEVKEDYAAFGHGGLIALGAMVASGDLGVAIEVVSKLDVYTGGEWKIV